MKDKKHLFEQKIKSLFGDGADSILKNMQTPVPTTFRVNTLKVSEKFALNELKKEGFGIQKGPIQKSYIVNFSPKNLSLSRSQSFEKGLVYIQKLSSMVPVSMLLPKEGDIVLDLCAAPGSKTIQIGVETSNNSQIMAFDNNRNRVYRLKANLDKFGVVATVKSLNSVVLVKKYPIYSAYFDKILLDAPCSNEGDIIFSKKDCFKYWNPRLSKKISKLQKRLAAVAVTALKPGGTLVYSTCTFSKEENEDVVNWICKKFSDITLIETKKCLPNGLYTGFFAAKLIK